MFVKTVKVNKGLPMWILCIAVLAAALAVAVWASNRSGLNYVMENEEARREFLNSLGWHVSEEYLGCRIVTIPENFSDIYKSYNNLQREQGFNLLKYRGKTVEIYSYEVYNYPGKPENIIANLIIFEGKLIGGDITCTELDGFMQGLMPETPPEQVTVSTSASEQSAES